MVTVLGELGRTQGTGTILQLKEVKGLSTTSQIMSDHVTKAAAGSVGWEDMLVATMYRCIFGYHFLARQMELA